MWNKDSMRNWRCIHDWLPWDIRSILKAKQPMNKFRDICALSTSVIVIGAQLEAMSPQSLQMSPHMLNIRV